VFASWQLLSVAAAYVGVLFAVAWIADRRARNRGPRPRPWTYALALAVYCTAWTFYGAVGRAADGGWHYLPIYLGPALLFIFGMPLLSRLVEICKRSRLTSVADFIGARYGNESRLAVATTVIAVLAGLPYLALQLRGISLGFDVLTEDRGAMAGWLNEPAAMGAFWGQLLDGTTLTTVLLAVFAMLFGTRNIASTENHHGMVLAVALESVVKLVAFVCIGIFAVWLLGGPLLTLDAVMALPTVDVSQFASTPFWLQTLLAAAAVLCLPRQFHLLVVENNGGGELRTARWLFPLYLGIFALFVLPLAAAGAGLPGMDRADRYVLALPQIADMPWLALLVFIGGFSAATGMVIVSCVALSTMISNEIVVPRLLRGARYQSVEHDLGALLRRVRRTAIFVLLVVAWLIDRLLFAQVPLAMIGLLSFSAIAHLAPLVVGGVIWPTGNRAGAAAGLIGGMSVWAVTTLMPTLLTGTPDQNVVVNGAAWSLAANVALYVLVSVATRPPLAEQVHTARLLGFEEPAQLRLAGVATAGDLIVLLERFFGGERTRAFLDEFATREGTAPAPEATASEAFARFCEGYLSSALGAVSARVLLARVLGRKGVGSDVVDIIEQTSRAVRFNRELLRATLDHMEQGVSVVDSDLRLTAWNRRYVTLFGYPDDLVRVGTPVETLVRYNAAKGLLGDGDADELVARRLIHLERGTPYRHERTMPDGSVIEISGNPMPGGGFVTTYSDVTAHKRAEKLLQRVNEELEARVASRTRELVVVNEALRGENAARAQAEAAARRARAEAETANLSKTRFLAAATHDLAQPLNAARLFTSALENQGDAESAELAENIGRSLSAMEALLNGLLDISRLEAGAQPTRVEVFPLRRLLETLATEFGALVAERNLQLRTVPCSLHVRSDEALLRRILQNLLSNALRYTREGRVLLGCRRLPGAVRIEVWDTGPGIPQEKQQEIFEEFRRLHTRDARGERGLGLGLAITERIARLLDHPLHLRSVEGKGSVFSVTIPLGRAEDVSTVPRLRQMAGDRLAGARVLCIDNDPAVVQATSTLLRKWGCEVAPAADFEEALKVCPTPPDVILADYHLDDGATGVRVMRALEAEWHRSVPGVLITADHTPEARSAATEAGYHFLFKPVKPAALRAMLSRALLGTANHALSRRPPATDTPEDAPQ
jgi:PAS domain S-box-containing protein